MATIRLACYFDRMGVAIPAEVFRHGDGQAVSIPAGLELPAGGVTVRQDGPRLVIEPITARPRRLAELLVTLPSIDDDFGPIEKLPAEPVEL